MKKRFILIYFALLLALLLWIYFPSFFHPPRSDAWSALYNFYRIDTLAVVYKWKYLATYDPLINTTFRPLSFLIPYFEYHIFGSNYIYSHIINFGLYFLSIILLYKLALNFCKDKLLITAFLIVFACLFSHFDIVTWPFHSHIILSFCLFLQGFILYINYLKSGYIISLILVVPLFLLGMLLYEVYLLWPFAIIILTYINGFVKKDRVSRNKQRKSYSLVIGVVYIVYICLFILNSIMRTFYGSGISVGYLFSLNFITKNIFAVFLNILFNNLLINLYPFMAYPLKIDDNLNMGGLISRYEFAISKVILFGGGLAIIIFFYAMIYLLRRKHSDIIKVFLFFMFLLCSELFILFHCKALINVYPYNFTQFRFQYAANAIFILIVLFFFGNILKPSKRRKCIIYSVLLLVLVLNIQAIKHGIFVLNEQLAPLQKLLVNIKKGIKEGQINKENKLFINDDIAFRLSPLAWNREMGRRCMRGTYQWFFSRQEIEYFSTFEDATWIINKENLSLLKK